MSAAQHYRDSKLGDTLVDALDELITAEKVTPALAMRILDEFDQSTCNALESEVTAKTTFKGTLRTYRFCDNVWQFEVADASFRTTPSGASGPGPEVRCDRVKIVAVDSKLVGVPGQ
mmetsp:Transcript_6458/g.18630  ORF Transcript_6458/g.18630 Transcript_6458/m.18630 type:complete len:117 (-) Transcript_6458:397-747(-)|eukprot:CAMPEP_0206146638 /NCGR_PEP_ID=MMETSP1473-20131121/30993_1 /ASSEMBLY_ACC=CAM_ASM_001109 /TAXON_ID=1461547 /ORGANISM="Stichococcus sp, Strain RCC1054" /LENGTH=116 /DNA_ID=CAMNT_0053543263 /DNA_START=1056 /DNA_END=1406 /DNA_ORIENTATION=-